MTLNKKPSRIADSPTAKRTKEALLVAEGVRFVTRLLRKICITNKNIEKIHKAAGDALNRSDILDLPDRFNDAFSRDGWIATGSMSADTMREAVQFYHSGKKQEAEDAILSWFQRETIALFAIQRAKKFNKTRKRWDQLQEALNLTFEERYWSAVPLILIACDGFASDLLGTGPFVQDADLTAFDSIVGHPNSLQFLIAMLRKGVRKSSDEKLTLPLRHGILHGQSLGYANRKVCMKAWLLMIALVDWAYDKDSEQKRRLEDQSVSAMGIGEAIESLQKIEREKRIMNAHEVQETFGPFGNDLDKSSPEYAVIEFLISWQDGNYGQMAKRSINLSKQPINKLAGQLRRDAEIIELRDFELCSVRQTTVARAEAVAFLKGRAMTGYVDGEYRIIAFRHAENGDIAMPADSGTWRVQEACMFDLLQEQKIDKKCRYRTSR